MRKFVFSQWTQWLTQHLTQRLTQHLTQRLTQMRNPPYI
nr:MAG TPA: hypothetical protein [Caudoviricetes sp.]